jgi:hypothetical protein
MFLKAVIYSKVMEVKLMVYDSDPTNARIMMKYNSFHSMNPSYGRERKIFQINLNTTMQMQCSISFQMSMQTIILAMNNVYMYFPNTSINSKI